MLLVGIITPKLLGVASAFDINTDSCKGVSSAVCKDSQSVQKSGANPLVGPDGIITTAASLLSFVLGVAAVIIIIVAGIRFAINGSNPQEITKSRNAIIYASIGLFLAVISQTIVQFVLKKL